MRTAPSEASGHPYRFHWLRVAGGGSLEEFLVFCTWERLRKRSSAEKAREPPATLTLTLTHPSHSIPPIPSKDRMYVRADSLAQSWARLVPTCWGPGWCLGKRPCSLEGHGLGAKRPTRLHQGSRASTLTCRRLYKLGPLSSTVEILPTSPRRGALSGCRGAGEEPRSRTKRGYRKQRRRAVSEAGRAAGNWWRGLGSLRTRL